MELIPRSLHRTLGGTTKKLKVRAVLDHKHVSTIRTSPVDDTIQLQRPAFTTTEGHPALHGVVAGRDVDDTAVGAFLEGGVDGGAYVGGFVCFGAVVEDVAGFGVGFGAC